MGQLAEPPESRSRTHTKVNPEMLSLLIACSQARLRLPKSGNVRLTPKSGGRRARSQGPLRASSGQWFSFAPCTEIVLTRSLKLGQFSRRF
jgi:hypothetical protein